MYTNVLYFTHLYDKPVTTVTMIKAA